MNGTITTFLSRMRRDRELWSSVRTVILPLVFQSLLFNAGATIDALMLGRWGQTALAGVSLAGQYSFVFCLMMGSCSYGLSIFAAQYWGKRDVRTLAKLLGMSLQINLLLAALFFPAALLRPDRVMDLLTNVPELQETGGIYLRWVALSYFLMAVNQGISTISTATGFARQVMIITGITVILDVIFNAFFIFGIGGWFRWGVRGAAIATVLVRAVGTYLYLRELENEHLVRIRWIYLKNFAFGLFRRVAHTTLPIFGNVFTWGVGFTLAAVFIGHLKSADAVAARSLAMTINGLFTSAFNGLTAGATVIIGNTLGRGDLQRGREIGDRVLALTFIAGIAATVLQTASFPVLRSFLHLTPGAENLLFWMIIILIPYTILGVCCGSLFKILNTGGDSRFTFRCDFATICLVTMPLSYLLAFQWHAPVLLVFFMVYADPNIKVWFAFRRYRTYRWLRNLTGK